MTLRNRLSVLVAAVLAPMAICAIFVALQLMGHERRVVERDGFFAVAEALRYASDRNGESSSENNEK